MTNIAVKSKRNQRLMYLRTRLEEADELLNEEEDLGVVQEDHWQVLRITLEAALAYVDMAIDHECRKE